MCGRTAPISILQHYMIGHSLKTPSPPTLEMGTRLYLTNCLVFSARSCALCSLPRLFQMLGKPFTSQFRHLF